MSENRLYTRKNIFIKKKFQTGFVMKFLILIVIEAFLAVVLFSYLSKGTVVTGYSGNEVVVARTWKYFLPDALFVNFLIIGVTAVAGFIVLLISTHKIAGPLYRFEKSLEEIRGGDLTHRFTLRTDDQLVKLEASINDFSAAMDKELSGLKAMINEVAESLSSARSAVISGDRDGAQARLSEGLEKLKAMEKSLSCFKTSDGIKG